MELRPILGWVVAMVLATPWCGTAAAQGAPMTTPPPAPSYPALSGWAPGVPGTQQAGGNPWGGVVPAVYQKDMVDAHGNQIVMPAGYSVYGPGCGDACGCGGGYGYNRGCNYGTYPPYYDGMTEAVAMAGYGTEQCGPHYFDARAEVVYLKREQSFDRYVQFTTLNADPDDPTDFVLASDQLDYDYEPGFRVMWRYDIGPLSLVEFGYMGIFDWRDTAFFEDPNPISANQGNLFSVFSAFGTAPADVVDGNGPMGQSERAVRHTVSLESELQNAEITYRRYWVGYSPRISGTLLAGARFTRLEEDFTFSAVATNSFTYLTQTENDLVGMQVGADGWYHVIQGIRLGSEIKAGVYNNRFEVQTNVTADPDTDLRDIFPERFGGDNIAFIGEASVDVVADILPSLSIRAGYEVMYLTSVALAGPNFNTGSPYDLEADGGTARVPFVADQSDVLYHGGHLGIEYIW